MSNKIRVAIAGVGNCASSLVQGVEYYRDADPSETVPGLMHVAPRRLPRRRRRVRRRLRRRRGQGRPRPRQGHLRRAEQHHPLRPGRRPRRHRAAGPDPRRPRQVLPRDDRGVAGRAGRRDRGAARRPGPTCSSPTCRSAPRRPRSTTPRPPRRRGGLRQRHPGVHRQRPGVGRRSSPTPACRSSATTSRARSGRRSSTASSPASSRTAAWCSTAPTSSTSAATWTSRTCSSGSGSSRRRSPRPSRSPARSTTASPPTTCTSARRTTCRGWRTASGPTSASKGRNFGDVPLNVELKLEVWDSPNSAGVIIDAVRCAKLAKDRGIGGPLLGPSPTS